MEYARTPPNVSVPVTFKYTLDLRVGNVSNRGLRFPRQGDYSLLSSHVPPEESLALIGSAKVCRANEKDNRNIRRLLKEPQFLLISLLQIEIRPPLSSRLRNHFGSLSRRQASQESSLALRAESLIFCLSASFAVLLID